MHISNMKTWESSNHLLQSWVNCCLSIKHIQQNDCFTYSKCLSLFIRNKMFVRLLYHFHFYFEFSIFFLETHLKLIYWNPVARYSPWLQMPDNRCFYSEICSTPVPVWTAHIFRIKWNSLFSMNIIIFQLIFA